MKALIVEDEFVSRKILLSILSNYGDCDVATSGEEAVEAFRLAHKEREPYDVICLDISLPMMSGQEVLKKIREMEEGMGIWDLDGITILMTTGHTDKKNIMEAFKSGSEGYLTKPIERWRLLKSLRDFALIP